MFSKQFLYLSAMNKRIMVERKPIKSVL